MSAPAPLAHEPLKFALWIPNVTGGLVDSKIEHRTDCGYDYDKKLAVLTEYNGFEYLGREVLPLVHELEAAELECV